MLWQGSRTTGWLWLLVVIASVGCDVRRKPRLGRPEDMQRYATLPLAQTTHHGELKAELARVVAEGGTPAQLARASTSRDAGGQATLPPKGTAPQPPPVLQELGGIFPAETCEMLLKRIQAVYPDEQFQFPPLGRKAARDLLAGVDERRRDYQRLVMTDSLGLVHAHPLGIGADTGYVPMVEAGNRLVALSIAEHLEANRLPAAIDAWEAMSRGVAWLGRQRHVIPRMAAVHLRGEAFAALRAIVTHAALTREHLARIDGLLSKQLAEWPRDADTWLGERAEGMHTYELVRDGYLLSVLSFEELRKYREEIGVDKLGQVVGQNIDVDELFFLLTMRKLLAACDKPFFQRGAVFSQLEEDLEQRRQSDQYPFVADQLLLQDVEEEQRWMALDRARCEAWRLAVRGALGESPTPNPVNPLTGQPYSVLGTAEEIVVDGIGEGEIAIRAIPKR